MRRRVIRHTRIAIWVIFLWLLFTIGCFLAPFLAIVIFLPRVRSSIYFHRFVRSADRLCASMLGFSGRHMLSTELTYCQNLRWMHRMLNEIEDRHCEESAFEEGAYCRLSDRRIGNK